MNEKDVSTLQEQFSRAGIEKNAGALARHLTPEQFKYIGTAIKKALEKEQKNGREIERIAANVQRVFDGKPVSNSRQSGRNQEYAVYGRGEGTGGEHSQRNDMGGEKHGERIQANPTVKNNTRGNESRFSGISSLESGHTGRPEEGRTGSQLGEIGSNQLKAKQFNLIGTDIKKALKLEGKEREDALKAIAGKLHGILDQGLARDTRSIVNIANAREASANTAERVIGKNRRGAVPSMGFSVDAGGGTRGGETENSGRTTGTANVEQAGKNKQERPGRQGNVDAEQLLSGQIKANQELRAHDTMIQSTGGATAYERLARDKAVSIERQVDRLQARAETLLTKARKEGRRLRANPPGRIKGFLNPKLKTNWQKQIDRAKRRADRAERTIKGCDALRRDAVLMKVKIDRTISPSWFCLLQAWH